MAMYSPREVFSHDLLRDERVLWHGQPDPATRLGRADLFLVPFGVIWTAFSVFWVAAVLAIAITEDPAAFAGVAFGLPFIAIGLYLLVGRFWYTKWAKRRTYYAVTDRRVLSLAKTWGSHISAAYIDRIPSMKKSVGKDGVGTIWFGNVPWWVSFYGNSGLEFLGAMYGESPVAFYEIREVDNIYRMVNELRNG